MADYTKALEQAPGDAAVWLSRSFAHAKLGQEDQAAGAYEQAVEHSKAIRLQADTLWSKRVRGAEGSSRRSWEELAADFTKALDTGTTDGWLWRGRGLAYAVLGQWDKAAADFAKAAELKPDDAEAWRGLGRARAELNQWNEAAAAWSKAVALKPDGWDVWYLRGLFHDQRARQYDAAASDYSKALELGIDAWTVRYRRGLAYAELGQWHKAADDFAKVLERGEMSPRVWHPHVLALLAAGDTDAYRRACARLLERFGQTEDLNIANSVAWVCVLGPAAVTDFDHCVRLMEKAVAREANYMYLNTLGAVLYRAGRFEAAIQRLTEAIKAHGKGGTALDWLFLAMAQHRLGRAEEARQALDKAVRWLELAQQGKLHDGYIKLPLSWEDRLEFQLLRRETETRVRGTAGDPKK